MYVPVALLPAPWARVPSRTWGANVIPWELPAQTLPHSFSHGLCPSCAAGAHAEHHESESCGTDGCSCEGVND